jgi:hypothetical protein
MKTIAAWVALAALAAALLFTAGWQVRGWHENRVDLQDLQELFDAQLQQLDELRQVTERARQERRAAEAFRLEQRQRLSAWLAMPGDDDCALDPVGLGLWNASNAGAAPAAAEPGAAGPVPAPAASNGRQIEDAGDEPRRVDGEPGRLRAPSARAGGLGAGSERDGH